MLNIRNATEADLEQIMGIYRQAQDYMIQSGNPTQWGHRYPEEALIRSDIRQGVCRVLFDRDGIHGVFALFDGADPNYAHIEDGAWRNDGPYLTIHRVAGDGQVHGVFHCIAEYCKALSPNLRIDTHADNRTMQGLIQKNGFIRCGIVRMRDGSPRIAYQWVAG